MNSRLAKLLQQYHAQIETRIVFIAVAALSQSYPYLQAQLPEGSWLVVADQNTWQAAGESLVAVLDTAGQPWTRFAVTAHPHQGQPCCDDEGVTTLEQILNQQGHVAAIAVGSGTITDLVKLAAYRAGIPMAVVATAPSMNGYTSGIAAVLSTGIKTTVPCAAPRVIIADLEVLANCPYRLVASGIGDLLSKPVSVADWWLAARLTGAPFSETARAIVEEGTVLLDGVAARVAQSQGHDREALARLFGALLYSGIAMRVAGSSSPASGGEHLISHYLDMTAFAYNQPHDLHGCQVGVATLACAHFYSYLASLDPSTIDVEGRIQALKPWPAYSTELEAHFGPLFTAVATHAKAAYPAPETLRQRLSTLLDEWPAIMAQLRQLLRTPGALEDELRAGHCPVRFKELGVGRDRARQALRYARDIRNRYTILHLVWEFGLLEEWADQVLDWLYE